MFLDSLRKIVLGISLMLLSSAAFSFSLHTYNGRCGDARVALGPTNGLYALAITPRNLIIIDPHTTRMFSPRAIEFIFFHECGHLKYGHTRSAYDAVNPHHEDKADCYAAKRFKRAYGSRNLNRALEELETINGETRNERIKSCIAR